MILAFTVKVNVYCLHNEESSFPHSIQRC